MKVAVVSAHYPPNFVSGGTLVPQRTSRALRERGVDVAVFAGWLGEARPALDVWDERDETGLPVRWVASTPWTGWGDRHNFDNPEVTSLFGAWLDEVRPDVVHCHSLQSLGAGLLAAAEERGLPTVVTLHDFWWWCARQFLATREHTPCAPVVAAGTCPCEVDRPWLDQRAASLAPILQRATRVVAVSPISARVAAANGVDPERLAVIENGIVPAGGGEVGRAGDRAARAGVRLTYAGGPNPMKGVLVLAEAVADLATAASWTLTAYGCQEVAGLFPAGVTTPPAYRPEDLDAVLADTDVLVLPSVMRESYSILAREALGRAVPVVTSDSFGPEEVVDDGRNGLIVPSGDAAALSAALARVIDDADLLGRLQAGCASLRLPTVDEQTDQLVQLYGDVLVPAPAPPERRRVRRVLFVVGIEAAPLRYRARLAAEGLELLGVHTDVCHYLDPATVELAARADAVVVYRVPATIQVLDLIGAARRRHIPVVFDVDDLIFDPDLGAEIPALSILPPAEAAHWLEGVARYRLTMEHCDAYIGSTEMLVAHATDEVGLPSYRWPNGAGLLLSRLSDDALRRPRTPGPARIGYLSGTNTHDYDWRYIEPAVARLLEDHPDLELWLVGLVTPSDRLAPFEERIRQRGLVHWSELPGILRDLDINLAPMEPGSRFNEAKSAIKWLEAALTATPTVASPTAPFAEVIADGVTGVLAADGTAWHRRLTELIDDPLLRARMGAAARREALLGHGPFVQGRRYLDILESVSPRPRVASAFDARLAFDEPLVPFPLEPYAMPSPAQAAIDIDHQRHISDAPGDLPIAWPGRVAGLARTVQRDGAGAGAALRGRFVGRRVRARLGRRGPARSGAGRSEPGRQQP